MRKMPWKWMRCIFVYIRSRATYNWNRIQDAAIDWAKSQNRFVCWHENKHYKNENVFGWLIPSRKQCEKDRKSACLAVYVFFSLIEMKAAKFKTNYSFFACLFSYAFVASWQTIDKQSIETRYNAKASFNRPFTHKSTDTNKSLPNAKL